MNIIIALQAPPLQSLHTELLAMQSQEYITAEVVSLIVASLRLGYVELKMMRHHLTRTATLLSPSDVLILRYVAQAAVDILTPQVHRTMREYYPTARCVHAKYITHLQDSLIIELQPE